MYAGWEQDANQAELAFRWTGGAVRLIDPVTDPVIRRREWGHAEKDEYTLPFGPWSTASTDEESAKPWVWRYGLASAGTGIRYAVLATKVHLDVAAHEGGPVILTVLAPWQDSHAVAAGGYLDESYVAEHLTAGRARDGRLHGGDLRALTLLIRGLLGRET